VGGTTSNLQFFLLFGPEHQVKQDHITSFTHGIGVRLQPACLGVATTNVEASYSQYASWNDSQSPRPASLSVDKNSDDVDAQPVTMLPYSHGRVPAGILWSEEKKLQTEEVAVVREIKNGRNVFELISDSPASIAGQRSRSRSSCQPP